MSTATISEFNSDTVVVSSRLGEDLLREVIKLASEGYTIVSGTTRLNRTSHQVCMNKPNVGTDPVKEPIEAPVEGTAEITISDPEDTPESDPESVPVEAEEKKEIDYQLIKSFKKDKDKLEDYGKTFGIDLKKNKSFVNMTKDLTLHVKGS